MYKFIPLYKHTMIESFFLYALHIYLQKYKENIIIQFYWILICFYVRQPWK